MIITLSSQEKTIGVGQYYKVGGGLYLLCQIDAHQVVFVDIVTGNRLTGPREVKNEYRITDDELSKIACGYPTKRLYVSFEGAL